MKVIVTIIPKDPVALSPRILYTAPHCFQTCFPQD